MTRKNHLAIALICAFAAGMPLANAQLHGRQETRSGVLEFEANGYPTDDTVERMRQEIDYQRAVQALEVYAYRVRKYVGAYVANLVKVDGLVFTGGIGQNGVKMRERICHRLENLGIFMDYVVNTSLGAGEGIVSAPYSPIAILVVPTNEELQIAIDSYDLIFGAAKLNRKIIDLPIRYRDRTYGTTNIQRWRHGLLLLRMVAFAALRLKFT